MNLYDLALHPKAFKSKDGFSTDSPWWGRIATDEQFAMLNDHFSTANPVNMHEDENEFRMHLIFVHWATANAE